MKRAKLSMKRECYEFDDPADRICNSLTPDTPMFTVFRDVIAKCMAVWSDGPNNYVVARSNNGKKFVCFTYTKTKYDDHHPLELYLSSDDSCRDLLSRESATVFTVDSTPLTKSDPNFSLPQWATGNWTVVGGSGKHFHISDTQIILYSNGRHIHEFKLIKLLHYKKNDDELQNQTMIRIKGKALQHCTSLTYCITLTFRSHLVIDISLEQRPLNFDILTDQTSTCPQSGIYKSTSNYRPLIQISACTNGGVWTLLNGCEKSNQLTFTTSCSHEIVPDVQVITAIKGTCLATWSDKVFQKTLVVYEQSRSFCLVSILQQNKWIGKEKSTYLDSSNPKNESIMDSLWP
ncbi:unnamed protein product [Didymodactylos carnosus]|uniref:DUF7042 domain-containing protein n=1 Tax=Didymodactylos carnosus TaxID=1234261 RepID=A0A814EPD6_9BILA|nr:unnamed protein product [Didymodactylos carnosus]CAF0968892.1 unnamed protein product [Didymodactylos carnosus]CAF3592411.1 unnamed protein product [Didymodactylos carnosus]CAF3742106.1 unnamed protein product [Didymodactylos carnosus]